MGDFAKLDLPREEVDVVTAVAMLHHVDHEAGLKQLAQLVAPGGLLLVVGLSFSRAPGDYARDVWDAIAIRRHKFTKHEWHTTAPVAWPPPLSYDEVRVRSSAALPNCKVTRAPYFRYSLAWTRPDSPGSD